MIGPFTTNCCTSTISPNCRTTPNTTSPFFGASLAETPTIFTAYPSTLRPPFPIRDQLLLHKVPALPRHGRRHHSTAGIPRRRPDHGAPTRSRQESCHLRHVRNSLRQNPQPFLRTRMGPKASSTPHPSLLVGHPLPTPSHQRLKPPDSRRGRTSRTIAVSGRTLRRTRVQPRPVQPLV